jgi:hypothetical protein
MMIGQLIEQLVEVARLGNVRWEDLPPHIKHTFRGIAYSYSQVQGIPVPDFMKEEGADA